MKSTRVSRAPRRLASARTAVLLAALVAVSLAAAVFAPAAVNPTAAKADDAFVFAYFVGNGEDGLHLAHSADGLTWTALGGGKSLLRPAVGRDKLMRDPHIVRGRDGLYHMVWTSSWTEPVIGYASSKDLINWSEQRAIKPMGHEPQARNVWAPELFYDEDAKHYLLFWATTIPGRFPGTDAAGDNGYNHRMYVTTTKDFRSFTPTRLFYDDGFNVIDATVVRDGRRHVMFLKDETRQPVAKKNLRYAVADKAAGPYGPASEPITGDYWAEGPSALKVGRRWIVYFDKYRDKRYGAVASADMKSWEDISEQVRFPAGARHGTALRVPRSLMKRLLELK